MHVVDAGIGTESDAVRGQLVGGVTGQEESARGEAVGDQGRQLRATGGEQLHVNVGAPDRLVHCANLLAGVDLEVVAEHQYPAAVGIGDKERPEVRLLDLELDDPRSRY